ncbi:MAG TPA: CBS domain-containing protein [bacterium]|nr:CBS domain-containing protein [bacterium]
MVDLNSARTRDSMVTEIPLITSKTTVATALKLLREHKVPALPVMAEEGLLGLVDEKALLRLTPSEATTLDVYELREILDRMTVGRLAVPAKVTLRPDDPLDLAAALMVRGDLDVVPVVDDGWFVGLLTWSGLLAAMIGETAAIAGPAA